MLRKKQVSTWWNVGNDYVVLLKLCLESSLMAHSFLSIIIN